MDADIVAAIAGRLQAIHPQESFGQNVAHACGAFVSDRFKLC
ncbi:MAG: hypothetical protein JWQ90_2919 [Hydrocarboniphaga sp.]|nr:hypothetical protein [Hydrocarboniphaga sp.]MDB5970469.1 hypothetical protein [Hydrocarboniphaga sp.]